MKALKKARYAIKNLKNRVLNALYTRKRVQNFAPLPCEGSTPVVMSITFEKPQITAWQIEAFQRCLPNVRLVIFDNSINTTAAHEIKAVAQQHGIEYTKLPRNTTKHPNRSHALALNWIYKHYIQVCKPEYFGFVDHDLIPFKTVDLVGLLAKQPFYGLKYPGNAPHWYLWAGYHFYRYSMMAQREVNFMYDFENELDTAGWNYHTIFKHVDSSQFAFASNEWIALHNLTTAANAAQATDVQIVDRAWVHIGGIGYNQNYANKMEMIQILRNNPIAL